MQVSFARFDQHVAFFILFQRSVREIAIFRVSGTLPVKYRGNSTTKPFPSLGLMIRRVITIFLYFRTRRNLHGRVSSCLRRTLPLFALRLSRSHVYLPVRHGCVTLQAIRVINRRSYVTQRRIVRYWPWNDLMFIPFNVSIVQDSWCYVLWAVSLRTQANFVCFVSTIPSVIVSSIGKLIEWME